MPAVEVFHRVVAGQGDFLGPALEVVVVLHALPGRILGLVQPSCCCVPGLGIGVVRSGRCLVDSRALPWHKDPLLLCNDAL